MTKRRGINLDIIDTPKQLADLVDWIIHVHSDWRYEPALYIDLEGVNLCREGSISILTLAVDNGIPTMYVALIDVSTLGHLAFDTAGSKLKSLKQSLRTILEDSKIPKVFFDVRNDSDALFAHYGIAMQGVEDVQLMESATRTTTESRRFLNGLNKCVEDNRVHVEIDGGIDRTRWTQAKAEGERLFKAERGGSYEVFNIRPVPKAIMDYCAGDVQCLPALYRGYRSRTNTKWQDLVKNVSQQRVIDSQLPGYQSHGQHQALAPWSAEHNKLLDEWNYKPTRGYFDDDMDNDMDNDMDDDIYGDDWDDDQESGYDFEDWTRCEWQGPPS